MIRESSDHAILCLGYILSMSMIEKMGGKILEATPGETRPRETVRSEDGTVNRTSIVWLSQDSIPGLWKRRVFGRSGDPTQDPPSRCGFYVPQPIDTQDMSRGRRRMGLVNRTTDNRRTG